MALRKKNIIEEPKTPPRDVGRYGSITDFTTANAEAIAHQSKDKNQGELAMLFWREPVHAEHLGAQDQRELRQGAIEGLLYEDHPWNLQAIMFDPARFAIRRGEIRFNRYGSSEESSNVRKNIIATLIKASDDPGAAIKLSLQEVDPEQQRIIMNQQLHDAVIKKIPNEPLIESLLKAGADGNAYGGKLLAYALLPPCAMAIADMLCTAKKPVNLDDALIYMTDHKKDFNDLLIKRLEEFRKKHTGEPANEADAKIAALTKDMKAAKAQITEPRENAPAPAASVQQETAPVQVQEVQAPVAAPAAAPAASSLSLLSQRRRFNHS